MDDLFKKERGYGPAQTRVASVEPLLFYIGIMLLFFVLAAYAGLVLLNKAQEDSRQTETEQIRTKLEGLKPELLEKIFALDAQLKNLKRLVTEHALPSHIFKFLESNTYPQVFYDTFGFSRELNRIELSGKTVNFTSLASQISLLERNPNIDRVEFGGLSFEEGSFLNFKLVIFFKPQFLRSSVNKF